MTSTELGVAVAGVVLVCWVVGAYNRLVSLRNVLVERFAAVDALCRSRHALIERQVELLATALRRRAAAPRRAARREPAGRRGAAPRAGPAGAGERGDEPARRRGHPRRRTGPASGADRGRRRAARDQRPLASDDATLVFARREFNAAVEHYNAAVRQFPTVVVAWMFGFAPARML
jgi:LemA protein